MLAALTVANPCPALHLAPPLGVRTAETRMTTSSDSPHAHSRAASSRQDQDPGGHALSVRAGQPAEISHPLHLLPDDRLPSGVVDPRSAHPEDEAIRTGGPLSSDQALGYLERIAVALETLTANGLRVIQSDAVAAKAPRKRNSRGKKRIDAEGDRKISEAWHTGSYKTYAECGREFGRAARDAKLAVGRYDKYLKRHPGKR